MEPARKADSTGGRGGRLVPELTVRGTGPAAVTIAGLTAGGGALLVFVSEHCPTSALALRRLGPLCQDWAQAGLTAVAIFEDPLEVAIRTARRLGWSGQVAADDPPYPASRAYRVAAVPTAVLVGGDGVLAGTVTGWDQPRRLQRPPDLVLHCRRSLRLRPRSCRQLLMGRRPQRS